MFFIVPVLFSSSSKTIQNTQLPGTPQFMLYKKTEVGLRLPLFLLPSSFEFLSTERTIKHIIRIIHAVSINGNAIANRSVVVFARHKVSTTVTGVGQPQTIFIDTVLEYFLFQTGTATLIGNLRVRFI